MFAAIGSHSRFGRGMASLLAVSAGLFTSCGGERNSVFAPPAPSPLPVAGAMHDHVAVPAPLPPLVQTLTVAEVVTRALAVHPVAQAGAATREQAYAEMVQARAWANPAIDFELGQSRSRIGNDQPTAIGAVRLEQRFEWPSKRSNRISAAGAVGEAAQAITGLQRLEVEAAVRQTTIDLIFARKEALLAQAGAASLSDIVAVVERRAAAGEAGRTDQLRAQVETLRAAQAVDESTREVAASYAALNAWCGGSLPDQVIFANEPIEPMPTSEAIAARLEAHPQVIQLVAIIRQRRAEIAREQAGVLPDVTVGVFAERETDEDRTGVALGLEIPLWNRNQGGRAAATAALARAEADLATVRLQLSQAINRAKVDVEAANARLSRFGSGLRPAAEETLRLALLTYQANECGILDLLEAFRTAQEVREQSLAAERRAVTAILSLSFASGTFTAVTGAVP